MGRSEVIAAVGELEANPADLGAWLQLCRALERADDSILASSAYRSLGLAASELGAPALAVACARSISMQSDAAELVDAIASTHCRGSTRIDDTLLGQPPVPPRGEPPKAPAPEPADLTRRIGRALDVAARLAAGRAPDRLPPTPLLSALEPAELGELVTMMTPVWRREGERVITLGEPARKLYWIARGGATATRDDHELGALHSNTFFGEIALLAGTTRTASVTCDEDSWILEIPAESVESIAVRAPKLARVLANYARARLLATVMRTSELFSRLDEGERRELLPRFQTRLCAAGDTIVEQGVENDCLFVVASGQCEVRDQGGVWATLGVGDGIGEMSLLARKPASASVVVTAHNTVVLVLSRDEFDVVAVKHPALLAQVYKLLVTRERENRDAIVHDASDLVI